MRVVTRQLDRIARRIAAANPPPSVRDIPLTQLRLACEDTVTFIAETMPTARALTDGAAVMDDALDRVSVAGLTVEFGVATGTTLRRIAANRGQAFGFDSFQGLPQDWTSTYRQGAFAQPPPQIPGGTLLVGWFDETLPGFLAEHPEPFAFVHVDSDLYSSAKTIFDLCRARFVPGTVIVFDEYFNYPGWRAHEHAAFREFLTDTGLGVEHLAFARAGEQVSVVLA